MSKGLCNRDSSLNTSDGSFVNLTVAVLRKHPSRLPRMPTSLSGGCSSRTWIAVYQPTPASAL